MDAIRELLSTHKLSVAAVGTVGDGPLHKWTLTHADPAIRARAKGFIRGIIEKAAALGAPANSWFDAGALGGRCLATAGAGLAGGSAR